MFKKELTEEEFSYFLEKLCKLSPFEVMGVASLLGVPYFKDDEKTEAREGEDILSDLINAYAAASYSKRTSIYRKVKKAAKEHDRIKKDGYQS